MTGRKTGRRAFLQQVGLGAGAAAQPPGAGTQPRVPHPNHPEGGMLFPKLEIDEMKKQEVGPNPCAKRAAQHILERF